MKTNYEWRLGARANGNDDSLIKSVEIAGTDYLLVAYESGPGKWTCSIVKSTTADLLWGSWKTEVKLKNMQEATRYCEDQARTIIEPATVTG